jgi:FkbM family methyltransferase
MPSQLSTRSSRSLHRVAAAIRAWGNYGNPVHIIIKRCIGRNSMMTVADRQTGVRLRCTVGSHQAFGETWYNRDYDVPRLPIRPGDVVIDIGANQGFFTCYAAQKGARVYAFEPFVSSFETLKLNVTANHFDDAVTARPWAIADQNGVAELTCSDRLGGASNTIVPRFAAATGQAGCPTLTVPTRTLPDVIDHFSLSAIRLCKLDCEGAEVSILEQMKPCDLQRIDAFVLEFHPEAYELRQLVELVFAWRAFQISFAKQGRILRLVRNEALLASSL